MALLNQKLIKSIFENNFYGFKEIKSIERLITVEYTQENLIYISEILKTGAYSRIDKLEPSRNVLGRIWSYSNFQTRIQNYFMVCMWILKRISMYMTSFVSKRNGALRQPGLMSAGIMNYHRTLLSFSTFSLLSRPNRASLLNRKIPGIA